MLILKRWCAINKGFFQKYFLSDNLSEKAFDRFYLGIPLLVSVGVKAILLFFLHQSAINMDGILYINAAKQYAAGNMSAGFSIYPMPAYPMLMALIHTIIPNWISAGYFISIGSMILSIIPLYYLTKAMFGPKSAFWASLMFALLPKMNEWALYVSRDALFLLISACLLHAVLLWSRKSDFFLFGIIFVLVWTSILIRIEGLIFVFFYAGLLFYRGLTVENQKKKYFLKLLLWLGFPFGIAFMLTKIMGVNFIAANRFDQVFNELFYFLRGHRFHNYFQIYNFFSEAENYPPFSGWHYNFASLSRHYILIIYLMGMVEIVGKIISPLSCIPLYRGLRKPFTAQGKYIFWIFFIFIGLVYYSLLTRDFVATRFLMIPAFLLLPWIGAGINALWMQRRNSSHRILIPIVIFFVVSIPAVKTFCLIEENDNTIPRSVAWFAMNSSSKKIKIITNADRLPFYATLEKSWSSDWTIEVYKNKNFEEIKKIAVKNKAAVLILKIRLDKSKEKLDFNCFKELKRFSSGKEVTIIYALHP
ncbi:Dolichyl-phosphate-mannose-protein mannosyltransferase [Desulfocicer vacuolatum DSM 3385]|uniref:Dolichyl-phosphate-mannose-protein mannosyltransferase n=1 Tax=Desulfocicer vacuolatum DSM 3385 TaxID=1121400 RepID=A0A1W1ZBL5_9BACT|nr:glycosyltransferase family 39 protein [Desulfocicer vacuolatum]SMC45777.1 Dolichyl-phosphate-mannose-protein mannosyltransferase [Desulfocicer vacuolatum DSM 3385]